MIRKALAVGIIFLFIGICIIPATAQNISMHTSVQEHLLTSRMESWNETQKLIAADGTANDLFGCSISQSYNTILIGAYNDDENGEIAGSAYVFIESCSNWTQQAKLLASDGSEDDWFGWSVALDGDTAFIGAPYDDEIGNDSGSVYVFIRSGTTWTEQQKLHASDEEIDDLFGYQVSLEGDTAIIGAIGDTNSTGSAYVFTCSGTTWSQQAKLQASDGAIYDFLGFHICLDGNTVLLTALHDNDNGEESGSAYIFTRNGTTWTQQAKLLASDGTEYDYFGFSCSLDGDTAIIGAFLADNNEPRSGSAYIFTRSGTKWTQQAKLIATDGSEADEFGDAVSLDGDTALIGAWGGNSGTGAAYAFTRNGNTWTHTAKLLASDGATYDHFGCSVFLKNNTAFIGSYHDDDNGIDSGSTYVFTKYEETPNPNIQITIQGGIGVNVNITNNGTANISDLNWQINVQGGILGLINKTVNGTIDIAKGETKTVGTGLLLGFGGIQDHCNCR